MQSILPFVQTSFKRRKRPGTKPSTAQLPARCARTATLSVDRWFHRHPGYGSEWSVLSKKQNDFAGGTVRWISAVLKTHRPTRPNLAQAKNQRQTFEDGVWPGPR